MTRILAALGLCLIVSAADAHKPSDSYLRLSVEGATVEGRWDLALRDLHERLNLDTDGDGAITWGEVRGSRQAISDLALASLTLTADGTPCVLRNEDLAIRDHSDGPYASLALTAECASPPVELGLRYSFLFDLDPTHRGLLYLRFGGTHSAILSPARPDFAVSAEHAGGGALFLRYLREGTWHIWAGLDHLLFLLCLLLPAVLQRQRLGQIINRPLLLRDMDFQRLEAVIGHPRIHPNHRH